jgi:hypothetical protein
MRTITKVAVLAAALFTALLTLPAAPRVKVSRPTSPVARLHQMQGSNCIT